MAKSITLAARVDAELDSKLNQIADASGRSKSWLINEALRSYVANEEQFLAAVAEGKRALQEGRTIPHEAVTAAFARLIKPAP